MHGRDAAGPSPFEGRRRRGHLRVTGMDWLHLPHIVIASAANQSRFAPRKDAGLLRRARNDGVCGNTAALRHALVGWVERSETHRPSGSPERDGFRKCSTHPTTSHTRLRVLAAQFARALPGHSTSLSQEGAGKAGCRLAPTVRCAKGSAREPHSSIQVQPITRPSLRDGRTAYAVLSREPNSFWPPSPQRNSPAPRRLTRSPHSQELGRSNDGQDHTVLPYARLAMFAAIFPALSTKPETYRRDEPVSAVRPRDAQGAHGEQSALPRPFAPTLPRPPQARLATMTIT